MTGFCFQQCCGVDYTTRAYDLDGDTLWTADYFNPIPYVTVISNNWKVKCQVADATQAYVGGQRVNSGGTYWSLVAFDIATGELQWKRDLYADILSASGSPVVDTFDSGSGTYIALYSGSIDIELWGQGGSPESSGFTPIDGAQAGGYCKKTATITAGDAITWAIGLNSHDSNGGNTTATKVATTYTANGGSKTTSGAGTATNGDTNTTGGAGTAAAFDEGGAGGNSPNGGTGGSGGNSGSPGVDGNAPGGGGGGAGTGGGDSGIGGHGRVKFTLTPADPIGYLGDAIQLQINSSGNIVAMLDPSNSSVARQQFFVEVEPDGTLVDTYVFTQSLVSSTPLHTLGFTIDSDDTFHVLSRISSGGTTTPSLYELPSPYTTATLYNGFSTFAGASINYRPEHMQRYGERDFVGGYSRNAPSFPSNPMHNPAMMKGDSQTQGIRTYSDVDKFAYPRPTLSTASIAATGTDQAGAAALSANLSYAITSTGGVRLPSGTPGDLVIIRSNGYKIYPPSGGRIMTTDYIDASETNEYLHDDGTVNADVTTAASGSEVDYYFAVNSTDWIRFNSLGGADYYRNCPSVDSTDNIFATTSLGELVKLDSDGNLMWFAGQKAVHSTVDSDDNIYTIGARTSGTSASVVARDNDGVWIWGHQHHGAGASVFDAQKNPTLIHFDPTGDSAAGAIIASGQIAQTSSDVDFVSDPW